MELDQSELRICIITSETIKKLYRDEEVKGQSRTFCHIHIHDPVFFLKQIITHMQSSDLISELQLQVKNKQGENTHNKSTQI
uniref:Uncharacterized protein n=1 Tax=Gasterosteus aculeatus TaxID=69293 RepID=G3N655_GASAC